VRNISIFVLLLGFSKFTYAMSFLNNSDESNATEAKRIKNKNEDSYKKYNVSRKFHARKKLSNTEFGNELSKRNEAYDSQ
jgi:hypothetical protein